MAGGASADNGGCVTLNNPTTINTNKSCVRVEKALNGNVVNNATIGKGNNGNGQGDGNAERTEPGFLIGDDGLIGGKLVNNGTIAGGSQGSGALTLGEDADVTGGIFNNGVIASKRGSGISLGYVENDEHGHDDYDIDIEAAALTGNIVNAGRISGDDYGIVARYGTMSGTLINQSTGRISGDVVGVYIPDTFTSWTGGIQNSGVISGGFAGILIGDFGLPGDTYGGEGGESGDGGEHGEGYSLPSGPGVVISGGIFNYTGGTIVSEYGPSIGIGDLSFSGGVYNDGLITQDLGDGGEGSGSEYTLLTSPYRGVGIVFTAPTVAGGLTNGANGRIYGLDGPAVWITDQTQSFTGGINNLGLISGANDGVRIESATFAGGLVNGASGVIAASDGDGVFATSAWTGGVLNNGRISGERNGFTYDGTTFAGGFTNNGTIAGGANAVAMSGQSFGGGFANTGRLTGGTNGVALSFTSIAGGFTNAGNISGVSGNGVSINVGDWGAANARADIVNTASGTIAGGQTGFYLNATNVYGDFLNAGAISGDGENTGVHLIADLFDGNVTNDGQIDSASNALRLDFDTFDGSFSNTGTIAGGSNGAILALGTMDGDFTNSGFIGGESGNGVSIEVEAWGSEEDAAAILNTVGGLITGGETGFALEGDTVFASVTNDGVISGGVNGAVFEVTDFNAPFANTGTISGGTNGLVMLLGDANGGFTNSGEITGESGTGVSITATNWGAADARADIVNAASSVITGGEAGFYLNATNVYGDFLNNGSISGDGENTGVHLIADLFDGNVTNGGQIDSAYNALRLDFGTFDGAFSNTGTIAGGSNGAILSLGTMTGGFTNSGAISGEYGNGVSITATAWGTSDARADIVNTASGVISGGATGFYMNAGSVYGDFLNNGSISGDAENTGVHLIANLFDGNFTNGGQIDSAYNALHLEFGKFDGAFSNTGTIAGGSNGAILALGTMTGGFTNSGSITGTSGNGVSITATTWGAADARADITNTSTGLISGGATGFYLNAGNVYGDFLNNGSISGNGENTGVHLIADLFDGNVTNNAQINSAYNALRLDFGTFDGAFSNTGTIAGGSNGAILALGTMTGGFTNAGSITGTSGNGVSITATTWGAADARADITNTSTGLISGGATGFYLNAGSVYGDFLNNGSISGNGENTGVHLVADLFDGNVTNNSQINSAYNALRLDFGTFDGAFSNTGTIAGGSNGAILALGTMTGGFTNSAGISGISGNGVSITATTWGTADARADIVNTSSGVISGGATGFYMNAGSVYGDFLNDGSISGDGEDTGVHLIAALFNGNVTNNGQIDSAVNALRLDFGTFDGSFSNTNGIAGGSNGAIFALGSMTGDFTNSGSIGGESGDGVSITVGTWGSAEDIAAILNTVDGVISGGADGFELDADALFASVANDGSISGGVNGVVMVLGSAQGGFSNTGGIAGTSGNGVSIDVGDWGTAEARADITNAASGVITGGATGFSLNATNVYGDFLNDGSISGDGEDTGVHLIAALFDGNVTNNGQIDSAFNALRLDFGTFNGSFSNTNAISGGSNGAILALGSMTGDFTNSGSVGGESGNGVSISVGTWGSEEDVAAILNTIDGVITGGATGFALEGDTIFASVTNDGSISGGVNGAVFDVTAFNAPFANTGTISGGTNGLVMLLGDANGGFTNSGEITGESATGVSIAATNWGAEEARADIVNTSTGVITGGVTGFELNATNVFGDFINDGQITGGGSETGVHLIAGVFNGDVNNTGEISAASNALHLEFGTLNGAVRNTGTIEATDLPGTAVLLAIGNGAEFTNADGGLILGDVVFSGEAAYAFVGEDGSIEGSLIGEGDDDTIAVRGTHSFVGGTASNFASFTVENGGAALMGARSEGGASAGGYAFANVGALNVENGGTLYIDRATTLNVETYTQQAGGVVEFFLGAPEGFAGLTGDVIAGAGDYGRILVNGVATLNGAVVGFLDPLFSSANPDLNSVRYEDVIVANGGFSGDFSSVALIADSSLFEMNPHFDGNTIDVDVARTSLGDISDVPGVIVTLGGPFDAMVSDRSNGVGSSSCGLASRAGGSCFNRFAANDATQTMTDASPEDPFDWLRTGVREVGETAVWGRGIGAWGNTDGWNGSKGSKFSLAGAIVGIDHVFDHDLMAGVAAQWTMTDVDFKGRPDSADVENFELGTYASFGDTRLYLNANASAIWHNVSVSRFTNGGGHADGEYSGTTLSAFAEAGKIFETEDGMRIGPFFALSFTHLETDAYREKGTGPLLDVRDSQLDSLKSTVGARLGYPIMLESGRKIVPELRLGWAHEFMDNQASFLASVQGQGGAPSVIFGEKFARDTVLLGTGVTIPLSDSTNLYLDYDAGLNPDVTTHTVSAGFRITW